MNDAYYTGECVDPSRSLGYLVKRIAKLATVQVEDRFAGEDLTLSHWIALMMIGRGLADNCAKLARVIGHDSGATTRLVDQLEARGLLQRGRDGSDRRIVNLEITDTGSERFKALTPLVFGVWNEVLGAFSHTEVDTLIALLTRLVAALEARGGEQ